MSIFIDFENTVGKIKPFHAVNNAPIIGVSNKLFHFLTEAGVPYSRLHDTGGRFGGFTFVDIENIFRDMSADPFDPDSYDFAFTDWLIAELVRCSTEPFFRLGATIENEHFINAYHIFPPKNNLKWAQICEGIIKHYNHGWANGYRYNIKYWEIWNEPDNEPLIEDNPMWKGTMDQYFALYETASNYLKERFPYIKIGGYASCGFYALNDVFEKKANSSDRTEYFITFFQEFLKFITSPEHLSPLDFFSWHSYADSENNRYYCDYVRRELDKYGLYGTESILNEWNPGTERRGTEADACYISEMILSLHDKPLDMLMYYDGQVDGLYQGLFDPIRSDIFPAYFAIHSFGELYRLENQAEIISDGILPILAAADGRMGKILTVNIKPETINLNLRLSDGWSFEKYRVLDGTEGLTETEIDFSGEIPIPPQKIVMIECKRERFLP